MTRRRKRWVGWIRLSNSAPWQAVIEANSAVEAEALLADVPPKGRLEESMVLPAGQKPIGTVQTRRAS
jgi:hypothetical protein